MPAAPSDPVEPVTVAGPARPRRPGPATPRAPRPRLAPDGARYTVAVVATIVLAAAYGSLAEIVDPGVVGSLRFIARVYFGAWSVYSLVYTGLTWAVLGPVDGHRLAEWLTEDRRERGRRRRIESLTGSGGPLGAVSFCATAIGAVVGAAVVPELRHDPVVLGLAVLVVAATWLLITTVYAVHYARENADRGGLEFPSADHEGPPRLADHSYLSVQIGTAYNGADVTVTSRAMRRTVTAHTVVAFVFNTVLIALLVSLLMTVTT